jgi:hypothetical protein
MPIWVLVCAGCNADFRVWKIDNSIASFFFPKKPVFPVDGIVAPCSKCGRDGIYHSKDLRYRAFG